MRFDICLIDRQHKEIGCVSTLAAYLILCALYLIWQPEILHKTSSIDIRLIHKLNFSRSLVSNFILVSESQN